MTASTLHIPADLAKPVTMVDDFYAEGRHPLYLSISPNDDSTFAIYNVMLRDEWSDDVNYRATLIAEATSQPAGSYTGKIYSDVYVVCPTELAEKIVNNDVEYHRAMAIRRAFAEWVDDYPTTGGVTRGHVLLAVHEYVSGLLEESESLCQQAMAEQMAEMMGIDPSQVIIVRV